MKTIDIKQNDAGQRLDKFLTKAYPNLPQSLLYRSIRLKRIKLNGKRAEISTRLKPGDVLELYLNDDLLQPAEKHYDFLYASKKLNIVYEDENLMLLDKPEGVLCHEDRGTYGDTLIGRVKRYLYEKGEYNPDGEQSFSPALANRIDRNTGGIVIAAKNAQALRILNQKIKNRELAKGYLCLVHGIPSPREATLQAYLWKDAKKNRVYIYDRPRLGCKNHRHALPRDRGQRRPGPARHRSANRQDPSDPGPPCLFWAPPGRGWKIRKKRRRPQAWVHPSGPILLPASL